MNNRDVADILEQIGTFLELRGENPFKCRAWHNAARTIQTLTADLAELVARDELKSIKGIGAGIAPRIAELVTSGRSAYHDELRSSLPPGLLDMLRIPGLGPKRVKLLYEKLGIKSIEKLREAAAAHRLSAVEGFGAKTEENILRGIEHLQKHANSWLYPQASASAEPIIAALRNNSAVIRCEVAGSLRRRKEVIGDIDILVSVRRGREGRIMELFTGFPGITEIIARGETKSSIRLASGISCDLRVIDDRDFAFALAYFTGSKEHNVALRSLARDRGWSLNEYRFSPVDEPAGRGKRKPPPSCSDETAIYKALGLRYIPPELRENTGEIEASRDGKLPELIRESDIRGTFHCHTTASDGTSSLADLVSAARAMGWEYIGIADHSRSAGYAGGLTEERVKLQFREIDTLNTTLSGFRVFKGTESDILPDGSMDFSDRLLAQFDYVVASIHSKFGMTEKEATKRIIRALKHKSVTMLGHPTGRLLLQREGYPVNLTEVINAAADYGKSIEINSHPQRLDLDWRFCRYAVEKGVKLFINPDAHRTEGLSDVNYGVGVARKGWCTKDDVVNTRTLKNLLPFLNRT